MILLLICFFYICDRIDRNLEVLTMKIINISERKANELRKYEISCLNTEAILYYFSMKKKWVNEDKIFK